MDVHDRFIARRQKPGALHAISHDGISESCSFTDATAEFVNGTPTVKIPVDTRARFIGRGQAMPLAFGGILFFLVGLIVLVVIAWYVIAYLRAGEKAAEDGIDPEVHDHPDAGHVAGPQDR